MVGQNKKETLTLVFFAILLGIAGSLFVSGYWLTDWYSPESKRLLVLTALIGFLIATVALFFLRWIRPRLGRISARKQAIYLSLSLLLGIFFFFCGTAQWQHPARYVPFFLPAHQLQVTVQSEVTPAKISLIRFNTSLGDVPFDTLVYRGWKREGDALVLKDVSNNVLLWQGRTGEEAQITFQSAEEKILLFQWDGQVERITINGSVDVVRTLALPWYASPVLVDLLGILLFAMLSLALALFVQEKRLLQQIAEVLDAPPNAEQKREWLPIVGILLLALLLRIMNLENLYPAVDEYYHLLAAKGILHGKAIGEVYSRSLWTVTLPIVLSFRFFGEHVWAGRLPGAIFNTLAILPLYLLMRKVNRPIALLSIFLYAISPWITAFGRLAREYAYYPFYFYWILYGMIVFLEKFPQKFYLRHNWHLLLRPQTGLLGLALFFPIAYALVIDPYSTTKLFLLSYPVWALFLLTRFDRQDITNRVTVAILLLSIAIGGVIVVGLYPHLNLIEAHFNPIPLGYFFPNPPQQWYFERTNIYVLLGISAIMGLYKLSHRARFIPLFLGVLWFAVLIFFVFFSKTFFAPRHLTIAELLYIPLVATCLYCVYGAFLRLLPSLQSGMTRIFLIFLLGISVVNGSQVLLPVTFTGVFMPISEGDFFDFSLLQAFMLAHAQENDVLISTNYHLYVEWRGTPRFLATYPIDISTSREGILAIANQYPSAWVVIDVARVNMFPFDLRTFTDDPRIEYVGKFSDAYLWRWSENR